MKSLFALIAAFSKRIAKSASLMSPSERIISIVFSVLAIILIVIKGNQLFISNTEPIPAFGGSYNEEVLGDVKYLNPVLAKSDAEKSISGLIYDGLVKIGEDGNVIPDLAKSWEISNDGLVYTFQLQNGIAFHNGQNFSAADVISTINLIQDPNIKSAYLDEWKDVDVTSPDPSVVTFTLPRPYGPFIYQCIQGIISQDDVNSSLVDNFNGTGPYKFIKTLSIQNGGGKKVTLSANRNYFNGSPYIKDISFDAFPDAQISLATSLINNYQATAGLPNPNDDFQNKDFETERQLALIANLRQPNMANVDIRSRIMQFLPGDKIKVRLLALDAKAQRDKADELIQKANAANIEIEANFVKSVDYPNAILERNYDLILYGFDYGYDRDPYVFWHGSQSDAMNLAGYKDKSSDILLEDARMISDSVARNAKYDQFFESVKNQNLIVFFPYSKYNFSVKSNIHGIGNIRANKPQDMFANITQWFITERRVSK